MADPEKIVYKEAGGSMLHLHILRPSFAVSALPVVLLIHGGGWERESPAILFPHAEYFATKGFLAVCAEYRLMPHGGDLRCCLEDCADALLFVRDHCKTLGADAEKINVFGESAGGYLACCLGNRSIMEKVRPGANFTAKKVIDVNGIVDLTGKWSYAIAAGQADIRKGFAEGAELSPLYNISAGDPPVLILHGLSDSVVDVKDSLRFAWLLERQGIECETVLYPGYEHAFLLFGFCASSEEIYAILEKITQKLVR